MNDENGKDKGLDEVAEKISQLVNDLPNDGEERKISVTYGGDNHGNITFGNHITINTASRSEREERPLSSAELMAIEQDSKRQHRRAWLRSHANLPSVIMLAMLALAIAALFSGKLFAISQGEFQMVLIGGGAVFLLAGAWATRISRLEQPIIEEARNKVAMARQELHRRRVM